MHLTRSISKSECEEGPSKAPSAPNCYTWSQNAGSSAEKSPLTHQLLEINFVSCPSFLGTRQEVNMKIVPLIEQGFSGVLFWVLRTAPRGGKDKQDGDYLLRGQASPEEKQPVMPPRSWSAVHGVCVKPQRPIGHSRTLEGDSLFLQGDNGDESELYKMSLFLTL